MEGSRRVQHRPFLKNRPKNVSESLDLLLTCAFRTEFFGQTKYKWGSQPQNGDWGISQRSSAGSLRRLAGRVMAFAGRAAGRCSSGGLTVGQQCYLALVVEDGVGL